MQITLASLKIIKKIVKIKKIVEINKIFQEI